MARKRAPKTAKRETKMINGQEALKVVSPYKAWPGHIFVPLHLTAEQYATWYESTREKGEMLDVLPQNLRAYYDRAPLVLEWAIEGFVPDLEKDPTGRKIVDARLAGFVTAALQPIIMEANSLPNLSGQSNGTSTGRKKTGG